MQILVFVDLDDTLFQTLHKCPPGDAVQAVAFARDGSPLSFMTVRQRRLFEAMDSIATLIPVTARNRDAFLRVDLRFRSYAILNFGGVILQPDGTLEAAWDSQIRPQLHETASELSNLLRDIDQFIQFHRLGARARLISDFSLPLYLVVKHPAGNLESLHQIHDRQLAEVDRERFFIHFNHNNLSVVPRCLGKEKAVRYLLETHFAVAPVLTLGLGDSLTDVPFLQQCDFALVPRGSQLGQRLQGP